MRALRRSTPAALVTMLAVLSMCLAGGYGGGGGSSISTPVSVANGGTGLASGTSGGVPYYSGSTTIASSGALAANSLVKGGGAGGAPSTITTGTGILTALGVNVGSAGAPVVFNGALGTPSSGTLTNATGLPINTGLVIAGEAQGDILYRNGSNWTRLAAGTSGQFLKTQGAGANPVWDAAGGGGSPGGSDTQVQYNSSGSFAGDASFTTDGAGAVSLKTITRVSSGTLAVSGFYPVTGGGGAVTVTGGASDDNTGGAVTIEGGATISDPGSGGSITIRGGTGVTGGNVTIQGRTGTSFGGAVTISAGNTVLDNETAGTLSISAGAGSGGADINGGNLTISAGAATGSGNGGNVTITAGNSPSGSDGTYDFKIGSVHILQMDLGSSGITIAEYGAGALTTDANGNITATSDARRKIVEGHFVKGLDAVKELQPKNYKWKPDSGMDTKGTYTGFIAQDVKNVIPEAVGKGADGFYTLQDRPITAALVNAVKELSTQNDELRAELEALRRDVRAIKAASAKATAKPAAGIAP